GVLVAPAALPQAAGRRRQVGTASSALPPRPEDHGRAAQDGLLGADRSVAARAAATMGRRPSLGRRTAQERAAGSGAHRSRLEGAATGPAGRRPRGVGGGHVRGLEGPVGSVTPRPRLLLLCQTLPFPPDGGVWIRTSHVLRLLAQSSAVTA